MAITKEYTTEAKVESFLDISITTGEADDAINAAVDIIDQKTDRNFIADSSASARLFDGNGKQNLCIDECVEITKVEIGNNIYGDSFSEISAGGANGYYLLPNNYSEKGIPIDEVHVRSRYWIVGFQNHRITAKWGYSAAVPEAISMATTILAAGIYMYNRGGASGNVKSEKIGNYSITYGADSADKWKSFERALQIIEQYRRISL